MTKREALEKCMAQWQWIHTELIKMDAAVADGAQFQVPAFNLLKRKVLKTMGVPTEDQPLNECYLCKYTLVDGAPDCLVCPLKGYAWEQCETDGPYGACEDAYIAECFGDAADYALEICVACERAMEDDDEE